MTVAVGSKVLPKVLDKRLLAAAPASAGTQLDASIFDGGTIRLYTGSVETDAGDMLATGTLPSKAFENESGGTRDKHGTWSMVATKNGTARGLFLSNAGGDIKTWLTVTESGGGGDIIIDNDDVQIGDIIAIATLLWTLSEDDELYPNRPPSWTNESELDFSQAVPAGSAGADRAIVGTDWSIYENAGNSDFDTYWSKVADATAPQSPSDVWRGHWGPGSYGEAHTIPSSPYQITVTYSSQFGSDINVYDLTADQFLTKVGSSPASGQYSVAAGVYTFAAAQTGHNVVVAYSFSTVAGVTNGATGLGGGHGVGNLFTYGPGAVFLSVPITRVYFSMRLRFDYPDATYWHSISNKFVNITGNHSQILVQLKEGSNWMHAEELGFGGPYGNFGVNDDGSGVGNIPGRVNNSAVPINQWVQIEVLIDLPNHVFQIWVDGVLRTNATPTFASTNIQVVGVNAFRGGGGETLDADLYWKYDHFFIAW